MRRVPRSNAERMGYVADFLPVAVHNLQNEMDSHAQYGLSVSGKAEYQADEKWSA